MDDTNNNLFDPTDTGVADRATNGYTSDNVPSYMVAADTHNYGNQNQSFLDNAADDLTGAAKFVTVSLASGINSIYNTAASVDNWFGGSMQQNDLHDTLQDLDSNLGQYYDQHKQAADLVGFIATSFLPGMAGVKVLNAGQKMLRLAADTGMVGENMGRALGLLSPQQGKYVKAAIDSISDTNNTFSLINKNTIKAVVAGYGQSAMEAAAFETAVSATMNQSPILQKQSLGDMVSNIVWGGLAGGAIGGSIEWAKTFGAIKKGITAADATAIPHSFISELPDGAPPAEDVLNYIDQRNNLPPIDPADADAAKFSRMQESKVSKLNNFIRQGLLQLTRGDSTITQQLFDTLHGMDSDTAAGNLLHLTEATRFAASNKTEQTLNALAKAQAAGENTADLEASAANMKLRYLRLYGDDDAGAISDDPPSYLNLADTLKPGEELKIQQNGVQAGKSFYKQTSAPSKSWNPLEETDLMNADARYIWALKSAPLGEKAVVGETDLPLLEKAYSENTPQLQIRMKDGSIMTGLSKDELQSFIEEQKMGLANELLGSAAAKANGVDSTYKIAKLLNVRPSWLEGTASTDPTRDIFAMQSYAAERTQQMIDNGNWNASNGLYETYMQPSLVKLGYKTSEVKDLDGNVLSGMAVIARKRQLYQDAIDRVFAGYAQGMNDSFMPIPDAAVLKANRYGAGAGFVSFANGQYGTLASIMERIGGLTAKLIGDKQQDVRTVLEPLLHKVANDPESALEWSTINAKLRGTPEKYVLNSTGDALIPRKLAKYQQDMMETGNAEPFEMDDKDAEMEIPIHNENVQELVAAHIQLNGSRISKLQGIRANQGFQDLKDPDTFYPTPVDPKAYPHFAFVVDPMVTGTGHSRMLYADTEEALAHLIKSVPPEFKVLTKGDAEEYYKSIGQYDFNHTLNENYIDPALKRTGVSMPYYIPTDPAKVTQDLLDWHLRSESYLAREMVSHKYSAAFNELYDLGDQFTKTATSKYGTASIAKYAQDRVPNPYVDYIKTALNVNKANEYPIWMPLNRLLDKAVSNVWDKVSSIWQNDTSMKDLDDINQRLQDYGIQSAYPDAATHLYVNHPAPKGVLSSFVRRANSILSTITLQLDPMHAAHVTLGSAILLAPELKAVLRGISNGDADAAGELAGLANVTVPGTTDQILSPVKLIANSISRYFSDMRVPNQPLRTFYQQQGILGSIHSEFQQTLDALALGGKETAEELSSKLTQAKMLANKLVQTGEKYTGNTFANEFNTFLAADVMRQITDVAVKHGVLDEGTARAYIKTFVNRVHGNHLATQRPMMFQGPLGQAMGLFQSYQFNLMQQLFRHIGEGTGKDAAMMMGLQGTVFGAQSLPGFTAINQHIIGTASGNPNHTDLYDAVYGTLPKGAADWLMYGASSNMLLDPNLKINLYTRGDINPRSLTVVPVNPLDVPIVKASTKFFGNLKDTVQKLIQGGNVWPTLLQGLEHNGVSRPLEGLAQTLEGFTNPNYQSYSTSGKGNVIASNDLLSLANLSRIAGAKPLDEAIATDAAYRLNAYAAYDRDKIEKLGAAIKTTVQAGNNPTDEQVGNFAQEYAALGGKQGTFNKFMARTIMQANTSQANLLARHLANPLSTSMQEIMGGAEMKDFTNDAEQELPQPTDAAPSD